MTDRAAMWEVVFEAYYDAFFEELAGENLSRRWQLLDDTTKIVVAITTSGSAVAGWTLWSLPGWRVLWALLAGAAALITIIHATLKVSDRVGRFEELRQAFFSIRNKLETLRCEMRIDQDFSVVEMRDKLLELRGQYGLAMERIRCDLLRSRRFLERTQDELNTRLADQIQEA